ncbi:MAG: hypothetical protein GWO24_23575, partial [Akkermansiaceae bacterium]|nr:hypothetical protein [Akkermansiaceae bacterium]
MKAAMEGLKAAPEQPATPPWEAPPMEQEETPAFDTQDVSFLGLEKKVERAVKRAGCNTIGELKVRFLADTTEARDGFRKDAKLTKDQMIAIGVQLAGKAPSPGVVGVPATAPTPPAETAAPAGGGATDVPGGHSDRPWLERYQATRTKAIRMVSSEKKVEELREAAAGDHPDAVVNGSLDLSKLPEDVAEAIRVEESTYNVVRGQVIAGIWHCGLDPTAGTLD